MPLVITLLTSWIKSLPPPPPPPPDFRLHSRDITGLFWQLSWELIVLHCKRKYSSSLQFHRLPKLLCSMECWRCLGNKMNRNTGSSERQWVCRKTDTLNSPCLRLNKISQNSTETGEVLKVKSIERWTSLTNFGQYFFFFFFFESVVQRGSAFQLLTIPC